MTTSCGGALVEATAGGDPAGDVRRRHGCAASWPRTRSSAPSPTSTRSSLAQNVCFLYHLIGGGTGDWDVPVGGMGAVTDGLARAAVAAGATVLTGAEVVSVDPRRGGHLA